MTNVSLNSFVEVKLNDLGLIILKKANHNNAFLVPGKENVYCFFVWELIHIFGNACEKGNPLPFDGPLMFDTEKV